MPERHQTQNIFAVDEEALTALQNAQWTFEIADESVYELRLTLATPAVITADKANVPVIGLPTLDGFLSYVAFRAALNDALQIYPQLSQRLIWQWNSALRNADSWIDFQLPLSTVQLSNSHTLFDCSIGLPMDRDGNILIPAGAFFARNTHDLVTYPQVIDSIPIRRRVSEPFGRAISLSRRLTTSEGTTKALDNRLYFPLTTDYLFFFRGDKTGIERLLDFAKDNQIGIGKKTTLGYGQVASFHVTPRPDITATWAYPILDSKQLALIKSLPFEVVYNSRQSSINTNLKLFGCQQFTIAVTLETHGAYCPPYWLRERREQIIRYGSIIQKR